VGKNAGDGGPTDTHAQHCAHDSHALRWLALIAGPALCIGTYHVTGGDAASLDAPGRATLAMAAWMACWWLTESVPLAVTAMLPLVLFPLLGIASIDETAAPYANSLIFLFMGGFILGLGMQRCGLHRRLALRILSTAGNDTRLLIAAFMATTAVLSMWISNTATTIMILPIATSLLASFDESQHAGDTSLAGFTSLSVGLMLGVAYAASIGGVATLIGTPPNLLLAGFVKAHFGVEISMAQWLSVGLPFTLVMLPLTWFYLTRVQCRDMPRHLPGSRTLFAEQLLALGRMSSGERIVLAVFAAAIIGWVFRPQIVLLTGLTGLSDAVIAMAAGLVLFVIPVNPATWTFAMDWSSAKRLPWDILLLFGGGLTLASAITRHGVDGWLASGLSVLAGSPLLLLVFAVATLVIFLTELTSNTAVTATLLPVLAASAAALGVPAAPLLVATALAASCAFMLPVATPPNAIVFSSGHISLRQMVRAGFALNVVSIIMVTILVTFFLDDGILPR
jgi:sodium-dependent dicarboxylate transporter 2/3/5